MESINRRIAEIQSILSENLIKKEEETKVIDERLERHSERLKKLEKGVGTMHQNF